MSNEHKSLYSWQLEDVRDKIRDSSWSAKEIEIDLKKINKIENWLWLIVGIYTLKALINIISYF